MAEGDYEALRERLELDLRDARARAEKAEKRAQRAEEALERMRHGSAHVDTPGCCCPACDVLGPDDFLARLKADVTIPVAPAGRALSATEALALRSWYVRRRTEPDPAEPSHTDDD